MIVFSGVFGWVHDMDLIEKLESMIDKINEDTLYLKIEIDELADKNNYIINENIILRRELAEWSERVSFTISRFGDNKKI